MFNAMNDYRNENFGDSLIWSKTVQNEVMPIRYEYFKKNSHNYRNLSSFHNNTWKNKMDSQDVRNKILEENISEYFNSICLYQSFICSDVIFASSVKFITYEEIADFAIKKWLVSPYHNGHITAPYKSGVIIGISVYYWEITQMVFISFAYIS